ncbi:MAG TPA: oxygenase MpaB family protein, partial [Solirubrobacteraceae bacterium]
TVHGVAPDGRRYDAEDPDLLLWVWATLVDSALLVYRRYVGALSAGEIERYYAEQTRFASACGVPDGWWPATYGEFVAYYERVVCEDLVVGEHARRICEAVLHPGVPWPVRPVFERALGLVTVGLLPGVVRERYGLEWGPGREWLLGASAGSVRRMLPLLPGVLREFPAARAARRRVA